MNIATLYTYHHAHLIFHTPEIRTQRAEINRLNSEMHILHLYIAQLRLKFRHMEQRRQFSFHVMTGNL